MAEFMNNPEVKKLLENDETITFVAIVDETYSRIEAIEVIESYADDSRWQVRRPLPNKIFLI